MTGPMRRRYPQNWEKLAQTCKERANWQCEYCGVEQFAIRTSRAGKPYVIYLHAAHIHHDQANRQPELLALCISCHARYDYAHKQRERAVELERLKHQAEMAKRVDFRFYGG